MTIMMAFILEKKNINFVTSEVLRLRLRKLAHYGRALFLLSLEIGRYKRHGVSLVIRNSEVSSELAAFLADMSLISRPRCFKTLDSYP